MFINCSPPPPIKFELKPYIFELNNLTKEKIFIMFDPLHAFYKVKCLREEFIKIVTFVKLGAGGGAPICHIRKKYL